MLVSVRQTGLLRKTAIRASDLLHVLPQAERAGDERGSHAVDCGKSSGLPESMLRKLGSSDAPQAPTAAWFELEGEIDVDFRHLSARRLLALERVQLVQGSI